MLLYQKQTKFFYSSISYEIFTDNPKEKLLRLETKVTLKGTLSLFNRKVCYFLKR